MKIASSLMVVSNSQVHWSSGLLVGDLADSAHTFDRLLLHGTLMLGLNALRRSLAHHVGHFSVLSLFFF